MSDYDKEYQVEENLFGFPYKEFESFVKNHSAPNGKALDMGCGQGRDALMLAKYGYNVTAIDSSQVGISQMLERAKKQDLRIAGKVCNLFDYELIEKYDAVILDSILHFEKNDREKELNLLDKISSHTKTNGYIFIFVHKSPKKEKELQNWFQKVKSDFTLAKEGYINYTYEEKATNFKSAFQFYMFIMQKIR